LSTASSVCLNCFNIEESEGGRVRGTKLGWTKVKEIRKERRR
jgi:hypothetical protein